MCVCVAFIFCWIQYTLQICLGVQGQVAYKCSTYNNNNKKNIEYENKINAWQWWVLKGVMKKVSQDRNME